MDENRKTTIDVSYHDINEVEKGNKLIRSIKYKNNYAQYIMIVIAVAICFLRHPLAYVFAAGILAAAIFSIKMIRDYNVADIYDDCVIVYDPQNSSQAFRINNEDVREWTIKDSNQGGNSLDLILNDDNRIVIATFQIVPGYNALRDSMPQKESRVIQLNNMGRRRMSMDDWRNLFGKK